MALLGKYFTTFEFSKLIVLPYNAPNILFLQAVVQVSLSWINIVRKQKQNNNNHGKAFNILLFFGVLFAMFLSL
jgi:hypothetical protein